MDKTKRIPIKPYSTETKPDFLRDHKSEFLDKLLDGDFKNVFVSEKDRPKNLDNGTDPKALRKKLSYKEQANKHDPLHNLKEDLNPNNIPSYKIDLLQELRKFFPDEEAEQKKEQIREDINTARHLIFKLNKKLMEIVNKVLSVKEQISNHLSNEQNNKNLYKLLLNLIDLGDRKFVEENIFQQLATLRGDVNSFNIFAKKFTVDNPNSIVSDYLKDILEYTLPFIDNIDLLSTEKGDIYSSLHEPINEISPKHGNYQPLGNDTSFNLKDFLDSAKLPDLSNHPVFKNFKKTYLDKGHSSFSKLASDFGDKLPFERDMVERVLDKVKTDFSIATGFDGQGDAIQDDDSLETMEKNSIDGPVGPLDKDNYKKYRSSIENFNDIPLGKYGLSAAQLANYGYVKPGSTKRNLANKNSWLGKDDIKTLEDFNANKNQVQDKILYFITRENYKTLLRNGAITKKDKPDHVAGILSVAYFNNCQVALKKAKELDNGKTK